jgi:hypothetical protein
MAMATPIGIQPTIEPRLSRGWFESSEQHSESGLNDQRPDYNLMTNPRLQIQ